MLLFQRLEAILTALRIDSFRWVYLRMKDRQINDLWKRESFDLKLFIYLNYLLTLILNSHSQKKTSSISVCAVI